MKLFSVYNKGGKKIGHISAAGEGEALEKAKKRNPAAHQIGPHPGPGQLADVSEAAASDAKDEGKKKDDGKKDEKK